MYLSVRREAHELIDGHALDDQRVLAKIRAGIDNLLDQRDSPTWAFDVVVRLDPQNVPLRTARFGRLLEIGREPEAEPFLATMVKNKADKIGAWIERGMLLARAGLADRAAADFAAALDVVPRNPIIYGPRASICATLATEPAAYDRLLALRGHDPVLWYVCACESVRRKDWKPAVADFMRGGEPSVPNEFAFTYGASLLLAGDQSAFARYVARQAELLNSLNNPAAPYVLARIAGLSKVGVMPSKQLVELADSAAAKASPATAWHRHVQALAAFRGGDLARAEQLADESSRLAWLHSQGLNDVLLGLINRSQGKTALARARLDHASRTLGRARPGSAASTAANGRVILLDWLEFQVLGRELEQALFDQAFPADPFTRSLKSKI